MAAIMGPGRMLDSRRLLLLISNDGNKEPRFQIGEGPRTQLVFGIDVDGMKAGEPAVIDAGVLGYPLDKVIPPIPDPPATRYVRHERIQSDRLTRFWGRPFFLGAHVLLPEGYDEHPQARYPLVIFHGHFPPTVEASARRRPTRA
jgi:hypothetical protein